MVAKDAFATRLIRYLRRLVVLPHSAAEAAERSRRIEVLLAAVPTEAQPQPPAAEMQEPVATILHVETVQPTGPRRVQLAELNGVLDEADVTMATDYAAAMAILNGVVVDLAAPPDVDPFSPAYAQWVMGTYLAVTGHDRYEPLRDEADRNVSIDLPLSEYFPFSTGDDDFIGRYLGGVGLILASLGLPARSRIVEYGIGWGHVAANMARAGHHVTCVDIEAKFLALAQRQAAAFGCTVAIHHGEFGASPFRTGEERAAAVVFSEAFHHAFDHLGVLRKLRTDVLAPGGVLILAAEPIYPNYVVPWGIRPDGHAVWAVRRHGWMELGFSEDYLITALLREGFIVTRTQVASLGPFGLLYRAQLHEGSLELGKTLLPPEEAMSWATPHPEDQGRRWAQEMSIATLDHDPKWSTLTIDLWNPHAVPLDIDIGVGIGAPTTRRRVGPDERLELKLDLPVQGRQLRVRSETAPASTPDSADRRLGVGVEALHYGP